MKNLYVAEGSGRSRRYKPATVSDVIDAAPFIVGDSLKSQTMGSPEAMKGHWKTFFLGQPSEVFAACFLDARNRIITMKPMFYGTIDGASVHPRELVRECIRYNAAAIMLAHNHPSGVSEPSRADRSVTKRIQEALALIDVRLLDHFIVGEEVNSFAEMGWL